MAEISKSGTVTSSKHGEHPAKATGLGGMVESVKETAKDVASATTDTAGVAKDKVQEWSSAAMTQVKDTTQGLASATADTAVEWTKDVEQLIRRNPLPSLLIGFGVGLLVGTLLGRTTRS